MTHVRRWPEEVMGFLLNNLVIIASMGSALMLMNPPGLYRFLAICAPILLTLPAGRIAGRFTKPPALAALSLLTFTAQTALILLLHGSVTGEVVQMIWLTLIPCAMFFFNARVNGFDFSHAKFFMGCGAYAFASFMLRSSAAPENSDLLVNISGIAYVLLGLLYFNIFICAISSCSATRTAESTGYLLPCGGATC